MGSGPEHQRRSCVAAPARGVEERRPEARDVRPRHPDVDEVLDVALDFEMDRGQVWNRVPGGEGEVGVGVQRLGTPGGTFSDRKRQSACRIDLQKESET